MSSSIFPSNTEVLLDRVRSMLPSNAPVYLVGGAVRDSLLGRSSHDLDFVIPSNVLKISRQIANALNASFYKLDPERVTTRTILTNHQGNRQILDFATLRGKDIESDLRDRDFTINAMAVDIHKPDTLIDPLGGFHDLQKRILRSCSSNAFQDDPVRILRGPRLAVDYKLFILPKTKKLMKQAVPFLPHASKERIRDELFRILDSEQPWTALDALNRLGSIPHILPELSNLKSVQQSPPHSTDVWNHTMYVVRQLHNLLTSLSLQYDPEKSANWYAGLVSLRLGRYRQHIQHHLNNHLNPDRSLKALLLFSALYHDIGKPATQKISSNGRIRFLEHEKIGAQITRERARDLRLSNQEIDRLSTIIKNHMRPLLLTQTGTQPSKRAIYRFFRDYNNAGVDVCLLSLADMLATYGSALPQNIWDDHLNTIRTLLEAWWEGPKEHIAPSLLLSGHDLMDHFNLQQGPQIGQALQALREAQASGDVGNRSEALAFTKEWLNEHR